MIQIYDHGTSETNAEQHLPGRLALFAHGDPFSKRLVGDTICRIVSVERGVHDQLMLSVELVWSFQLLSYECLVACR